MFQQYLINVSRNSKCLTLSHFHLRIFIISYIKECLSSRHTSQISCTHFPLSFIVADQKWYKCFHVLNLFVQLLFLFPSTKNLELQLDNQQLIQIMPCNHGNTFWRKKIVWQCFAVLFLTEHRGKEVLSSHYWC